MNIVLFAMSQHDLISWTLAVMGVITIVLGAGAIWTVAGSWLTPRIDRVQKGMKIQAGEKPCCPPGAGCNDPSDSFKSCRRQIAMENGSAEDLEIMEGAWNHYHSLPKWRSQARRKSLLAFANMRDKLFFHKMTSDGGTRLPQLQMQSEEEVDAEIVTDKS